MAEVKFIRTGWGVSGLSVIEAVEEIAPDGHSALVPMLRTTTELRIPLPGSASAPLDLRGSGPDPQPGALTWSVFRQHAGRSIGLHHTESIDFDIVLSGSTTLGTEEGSIEMVAGDCALIPGIPHRWDAGPEGCLLSVLFMGIANRRNGRDA